MRLKNLEMLLIPIKNNPSMSRRGNYWGNAVAEALNPRNGIDLWKQINL
jgi:transposase InsO family protein